MLTKGARDGHVGVGECSACLCIPVPEEVYGYPHTHRDISRNAYTQPEL